MILVTGATGRLGSALISHLDAAKRRRAAIGGPRSSHGRFADAAVDLSIERNVENIFRRFQPTHVIHSAALADPDACETEPERARAANTTAAENLAAACARSSARLLFVSTDSVFDGTVGNYAESDQPHPINEYAASKLLGERRVTDLCPDAILARTNFVGAGGSGRPGLAEWILTRLNAGQTVPGFVDAVFSPLHTTLLAEIFVAMLDAECSGLYHVGSHDAVTKFDFARRLAERVGRDPDQVKPSYTADAAFKALRPLNLSLNVTKIESTLGRRMPLIEDVIQCFSGSSPA